MRKNNNSSINIEEAKKLTRKEYVPLMPYLTNIINGGVIAAVILGISYLLNMLVIYFGFSIPFIIEISYWFAMPIFILYSLVSFICLIIDGYKFIKGKIKNE